jgi:amidase
MDDADLVFAGLARQAELVRAGEVSSRELVEACLRRIDQLDERLNAFRVVLDERALAEAGQADARRKAGNERPLLGVPIAIKDDADVAGEPTRFGTAATDGRPAPADSAHVARLREAGAVIVGKTNVPELTQWPFTESDAFGVTRNPWDPERTPGGSSGGTAAAVAAGMVPAALGSDGGGSIRIPAACCGLFGLKPGVGLISNAPKHEPWRGLSVWGPLTRSVRDAALWLDVVADTPPAVRYSDAAASADPGRLRIAVSAKVPLGLLARVHPIYLRAMEATAELLRELGHEVTEVDPPYGAGAYGFVARYLRGIADDASHVDHPERLERRTRGMVRMGRSIPAPLVDRAVAAGGELHDRFASFFARHDVLLTPALATPPPRVGRWAGAGALRTFNEVAAYTPFTAIFNHTGQPAAAVPAGWTTSGLPLSVQVAAGMGQEGTLLALAAQLEAARPWAEARPPVS